jgi:hypothetical protein
MPNPAASAAAISSALKSLLVTALPPSGGSAFFQAVYEGLPEGGFQAQSPVAIISFEGIDPARLTMGAGRNQDKWTWVVDCYIDKSQQTYDVAYSQLLTCVDTLRTTIHAHVTLGVTSSTSSILSASLDNLRSQPDFQRQDGMVYSHLHMRIGIVEQYNTTIGA